MQALLPVLILLGQSGYAGSPLVAIDAALKAVEVTAEDVVYDLGCGDGRVCILASKLYGCRSVGVEYDANLAELAQAATLRNKVGHLVRIIHGDALEVDLSEATVVYLYHQSGFLNRLKPRLDQLSPNVRVVCLDHLPSGTVLKPKASLSDNGHSHSIYTWNCGVADSPLVATAKTYPGARFYEGLRDPLLVRLAQDCADLMAARGSRAYRYDGHPDWNSRFYKIRNELGMSGTEITAFSGSQVSNQITPGILTTFYNDWRQSYGPYPAPDHWSVVSKPCKRFGDGLARSHQGVWFACIITAD